MKFSDGLYSNTMECNRAPNEPKAVLSFKFDYEELFRIEKQEGDKMNVVFNPDVSWDDTARKFWEEIFYRFPSMKPQWMIEDEKRKEEERKLYENKLSKERVEQMQMYRQRFDAPADRGAQQRADRINRAYQEAV
jgi:tRNA nucleotidyltransferase/poly(A) polymerase